VKVDIKGTGEIKQLFTMLAWIQTLGRVGHSVNFEVFVDGDGYSRWKFEFDDQEIQGKFDNLRKALVKNYIDGGKDIECFSI